MSIAVLRKQKTAPMKHRGGTNCALFILEHKFESAVEVPEWQG